MKYLIIIGFTIITLNTFAQDTICFTAGNKLAVVVKEIYPDQIKYVRFTSQDYPIYSQKKSEIRYIRYANGSIENFNTGTTTQKPEIKSDRLELVNNRFYYKSGELSYDELWPLIYNFPVDQTKKKLVFEYDNAKQFKRKKITALWFSLGGGYLTLAGYSSATNVSNKSGQGAGLVLLVTSAAVTGTSVYFFIKNRKKEMEKRKLITEIYNDGK